MEILAKNTKPSVMLQLDVGTCIEAGADPVAWIKRTLDAFVRCIARIGRRTPAKDYTVFIWRRCRALEKTFRRGEPAAASNITWSSKRAARFPETGDCRKFCSRFAPSTSVS